MEPTFQEHLYAGRPGEIVNRALLQPSASFDPGEAPFVVAALAGITQIGEAEVLLRGQTSSMTPEGLVFAHVHIAMTATATGRYSTARRHLGRAAALRNATSDAASLFFLYYGLAHYRFATGRLKLASMEGHRAGAFLKRATHDYAHALWHELLGHLQVLTGEVRSGLGHLDTAMKYAKTLDRQDQLRGLATTRVLYEARYARKPKDAVAQLRVYVAEREPQETFTLASLQLELCRQQLLRKRFDDARAA